MNGMLVSLLAKVVKARWGALLPEVFKAAAEGKFGEPVKRAYWFGAGYRTFTGAVISGTGIGLAHVCASYPDMALACQVAPWLLTAGAILAGVGLVDGGVRAPWPNGTPKE